MGAKDRKKLQRVAEIYKERFKKYFNEYLKKFEEKDDLDSCLDEDLYYWTDNDGKMNSHQWRVGRGVLEKAHKILKEEVAELKECESFDELFKHIDKLAKGIKGFGKLAVYDTALRIGHTLGLQPEKVYLHRGAKEGARHLGFDGQYIEISKSELDSFGLEAKHIEDLLCIFKDCFKLDCEEEFKKCIEGKFCCSAFSIGGGAC